MSSEVLIIVGVASDDRYMRHKGGGMGRNVEIYRSDSKRGSKRKKEKKGVKYGEWVKARSGRNKQARGDERDKGVYLIETRRVDGRTADGGVARLIGEDL